MKSYIWVMIITWLIITTAYTSLIIKWNKTELWNWGHSLVATVLSVFAALMVGIWIYHYEDQQLKKSEKERLEELLEVEFSQNLAELEKERIADNKTRIASIENEILKEAIKSGLFDEKTTKQMLKCENGVNHYNLRSSLLLSYLTSSRSRNDEHFQKDIQIIIKQHKIAEDKLKEQIIQLIADMNLQRLSPQENQK